MAPLYERLFLTHSANVVTDEMQDSLGLASQQKVSAGEEPLPAGLALLRKLQAQGGVSRRSMGGSPASGQQHPVFQDPAILSATPSPEYGGH